MDAVSYLPMVSVFVLMAGVSEGKVWPIESVATLQWHVPGSTSALFLLILSDGRFFKLSS